MRSKALAGIPFILCLSAFGQTLKQENLFQEYQKAQYAIDLSQVSGENLSCRYISMLDGTYHDSDYEINIGDKGIKARSSKGSESFDLSGPVIQVSDRVYSEKVESSFIGWALGHEPAVFEYEYKVLNTDLYIAKSSKSKSSRALFSAGKGKALLSLYKCDFSKVRSPAANAFDGERSTGQEPEGKSLGKERSKNKALPN